MPAPTTVCPGETKGSVGLDRETGIRQPMAATERTTADGHGGGGRRAVASWLADWAAMVGGMGVLGGSEEHTSEQQSQPEHVCRHLLEKIKNLKS